MNNSINKHLFLKLLLIVQTILLIGYTIFAAQGNGWNLLQVFVQNIMLLNWNGQFNLDFSCYLTLSALWIMWRNQFSVKSIAIGVTAMVIGIMAFAPYLLYLLTIEKGDLRKVLIGNN